MVSTSDAALMNGGLMVQAGAMGPTTVMGQIMGALNTGLAEDLNIETLEHSFDCNVDEVNVTVLVILLPYPVIPRVPVIGPYVFIYNTPCRILSNICLPFHHTIDLFSFLGRLL